MDTLLEIICETCARNAGKRAADAYGRGAKREARACTALLATVVGGMATCSGHWLVGFLLAP